MYLPIVNRVEVDDVVCFTVLRCSLSLHDIVTAFNVNKDLIQSVAGCKKLWLQEIQTSRRQAAKKFLD